MSMVEALRRCPEAIVVPPRHHRYMEVSERVFAVFRRYTPLVEGLSVDEAFLDVTASRALFGDGATIAARIKADIKGEIGLTASAGVAPSKFVAKIASDLQKPDGLVVVPDDGVAAFLAPLPIERMWGVGPKTSPKLHAAGFATFGDLAEAPFERLADVVGRAGALHVQTLAQGLDPREVEPGRAAVSIGAEETFERDLTERRAMELRLLELASRVARRLHAAELVARGVTLKVKYADFTIKTRNVKLPEPIGDASSLFEATKLMLDRVPKGRVRLLGISARSLEAAPSPPAPTLFAEADPERRRRLEAVVIASHERWGKGGLTRAALLEDETHCVAKHPTDETASRWNRDKT
jgi:DNA polymerase-4